MHINWYPGHMTKSARMIEETIKVVDAVVYVLDSRAPNSCINPMFDKIIQGKPIIYVLNKSDLSDPKVTAKWVAALKSDRSIALELNASVSKSAAVILNFVRNALSDKIKKYASKGAKATLRVMVLGVPNTGKSTIINNLCGKAKTITGNTPGVTRGKQWVKVNDFIEVLDTPGTLYPKLSDQNIAKRLAFLGSIRDQVVDTYELSLSLIDELNLIDVNLISKRYNIDAKAYPSARETLEAIAKSRGFLLRGGDFDTERASDALIEDFRKGRMGRISLETPADADNNKTVSE